MTQTMKKYLPWALIALVVGIGAYLFRHQLPLRASHAGSDGAPVRVRGPNNVRIELVGPRGGDLVLLAYESGLFENEGLLVDIAYAPTTPRALADLGKQEVDLAVVGDVPFGLLSPSGRDIGVLATIADVKQDLLVFTPKENGVASLDDIKGKRLGIEDHDSGRYTVDLFLARHGLSHSDVTVVPLKLRQLVDAVRHGEVAAIADAFADGHFGVQGLKKPSAKMATLTDPELLHLQYCLVAPRGIIEKRRPLVLKVLRALLAASEALKNDPERSAKFVAKGERAGAKKVTERWKQGEFGVTLGPKLLSSLEAQGRWVREHNQDAGAPDWAGLMAPELLAELRPEAVTLGK